VCIRPRAHALVEGVCYVSACVHACTGRGLETYGLGEGSWLKKWTKVPNAHTCAHALTAL